MGIYEKLEKVQKNQIRVSRDGEANIPGRKYKYSTLDNILSETIPALNAAGLVLLQTIDVLDYSVGAQGLKTQIIDPEDGTFIESVMLLPVGVKPQDIGSAITYFKRYSISAMLGISTEDDDDAAIVSATTPPKMSAPPAKPASPPAKPAPAKPAPQKLAFQPLLKACQAKLLEAGFDYDEDRVMTEVWDQMVFAFNNIVNDTVPKTTRDRGVELARVLNIVGIEKFCHQLTSLETGHKFLPGH